MDKDQVRRAAIRTDRLVQPPEAVANCVSLCGRCLLSAKPRQTKPEGYDDPYPAAKTPKSDRSQQIGRGQAGKHIAGIKHGMGALQKIDK